MEKSSKNTSDTLPKLVIGMIEEITIHGKNKTVNLLGRIDTGATKSSIHSDIVKELKLGPVISVKKVKNANGISLRPVIEAQVSIHKRKLVSQFTVTDRSHMKYKILIGRNILEKGFLIDPSLDNCHLEEKND